MLYKIGNMYLYYPEKSLEEQLEEGIKLFLKRHGKEPDIGFFNPKYLEEERDYKSKEGIKMRLVPEKRELLKSFTLAVALDK